MKHILLKAILAIVPLFCFVLCSAQSNSTFYLNADYQFTSKDNAVMTGHSEYRDNKFKFTASSNKTNKVTLTGYFEDSLLNIKDGLFTNYTVNGELLVKGAYNNNFEIGLWQKWKDGKLIDSSIFEKGNAVINVKYTYYKNGQLETRIYKDNKNHIEQGSWLEDGTPKILSNWTNGNGDRTVYYESGKVKSIESSENGKIVTTRYFSKEGVEVSRAKLRKEEINSKIESKQSGGSSPIAYSSGAPEFPGGMPAFHSFFSKNFRTPQSLWEQVRSIEKVRISFMLDKGGFATDINVLEFSSLELRDVLRDVFNRMPPWNMKGNKSFGPVTYVLNLQRG